MKASKAAVDPPQHKHSNMLSMATKDPKSIETRQHPRSKPW